MAKLEDFYSAAHISKLVKKTNNIPLLSDPPQNLGPVELILAHTMTLEKVIFDQYSKSLDSCLLITKQQFFDHIR